MILTRPMLVRQALGVCLLATLALQLNEAAPVPSSPGSGPAPSAHMFQAPKQSQAQKMPDQQQQQAHVQQQQQQQQQQSPPKSQARAPSFVRTSKNISQDHLDKLKMRLVELETSEHIGPIECDRWNNANQRYIKAAGSQRQMRQSEFEMSQKCRQISHLMSQAKAKLDNFRKLFLYEDDQLEFVSNLVSEYVELKRAMEDDEYLKQEFDVMLAKHPQVQVGVDNLKSFVGYMLNKISTVGEFSDKLVAVSEQVNETNDIEQLDRLLKQLIDRENELSDDEFHQLADLANVLERVLADRRKLDVTSGKFRYLSGTLDGARAVILHKLTENEHQTDVESHDYERLDRAQGPQHIEANLYGPPTNRYYDSDAEIYYDQDQPHQRMDYDNMDGANEASDPEYEIGQSDYQEQQPEPVYYPQQARPGSPAPISRREDEGHMSEEEENEAFATGIKDWFDVGLMESNPQPLQQHHSQQQQHQHQQAPSAAQATFQMQQQPKSIPPPPPQPARQQQQESVQQQKQQQQQQQQQQQTASNQQASNQRQANEQASVKQQQQQQAAPRLQEQAFVVRPMAVARANAQATLVTPPPLQPSRVDMSVIPESLIKKRQRKFADSFTS